MLHEPLRAVGRQSTLLHAVQHGGVSCMGVMNPGPVGPCQAIPCRDAVLREERER